MSLIRPLILLGAALSLAACQPAPAPSPAPEEPAEPAPADGIVLASSARSSLQPVADSGVGGDLRFVIEDGAVRVTGTLTGLKPGGTHAFHIHEFGDCSAPDATSAGGHFNPAAAAHGDRAAGGEHHAGDIPNQVADANGEAIVDQRLEGLQIGGGGELDIVGRGVIVHADADDYTTQPTGNAGGRLACGVIETDLAQ